MCGIFGVFDREGTLTSGSLKDLVCSLAAASSVRGTHAVGVAYVKDGIRILKGAVPGVVLSADHLVEDSDIYMGHTRHTTLGTEKKNHNNHPFLGYDNTTHKHFAMAHNGSVSNMRVLRNVHSLPETVIETDSYVMTQLLGKKGVNSINTLGSMMTGSLAITVLTEDKEFYLLRESNPVVYATIGSIFLYASTARILQIALKDWDNEVTIPTTTEMATSSLIKVTRSGEVLENTSSSTVSTYNTLQRGGGFIYGHNS
jgi:glutamine phosphoribosylpyrophosphate amidotransferase